MIRKVLFAFLSLMVIPISFAASITSNDIEDAKKLVEQFQKVPAEHMFCSARGDRGERWEPGGDGEKVLPEMARYFSVEMSRLFAWIHCGSPEYPRPSRQESVSFYWDFRYGVSEAEAGDSPRSATKNIRVLAPLDWKGQRITIKVLFNYYQIPQTDLYAVYTLIKENGYWKIDDISLKGFTTEIVEILPSTKSLKNDIKTSYKRAEAKCLQDSKCFGKLGK